MGAASQICYIIEVCQFLNWYTLTYHRHIRFSHSNPALTFPKEKDHPDGWSFSFGAASQI